MAAMKPNRKTFIVIVCILVTTMMLYLKPGFVSLEGVLSLGYFPLEQMTDPHGGMAETSSGGPSFGHAYTLEVPRPDGGIRIVYLANPATLRVRGFTYSRMGPLRHGSWGLTGYRIIILQSVEKTK
jgi:hypothetical protein